MQTSQQQNQNNSTRPTTSTEKMEPNLSYTKGKGLFIFFNVSVFGKKTEEEIIKDGRFRYGATHDVNMVKEATMGLDVEYRLMPDLTAEETKKYILENVTKMEGFAYLWLLFGTHGEENDIILGSDELSIHIHEDIISPLHNKNCAAFRGKPKVYMFNACRGDNKPGSGLVGAADHYQRTLSKSAEAPVADGRVGSVFKMKEKANMYFGIADYCEIYSTTTETESLRFQNKGSPAIIAMTETLNELMKNKQEIRFKVFLEQFKHIMIQRFVLQPQCNDVLGDKEFCLKTKDAGM